MITPRTTRLVRAADPRSFRRALVGLCTAGSPLDARDRLVVVPTRAASLHLLRAIEDRLPSNTAVVLPEFVTRAELHERVYGRLDQSALPDGVSRPPYTQEEREALLSDSCQAAIDSGVEPPFHVRPGLIVAMLEFFDSLKRHQKSTDDFERLTIGRLHVDGDDRGAERLVRQTRFLATTFRAFERRSMDAGGIDEHGMREQVLATASARPWRHAVIAVRDRAADRYGLYPTDWDLLTRLPGLERLDVVVTDTALAGAFHERIHQWLPGIEETHEPVEPSERLEPRAPKFRDREEELIAFARWVRSEVKNAHPPALDRIALVVRQPLPYVYLARDVLHARGVPCQMFDALPLAAEPFAAALDLLFSFVSANFARVPAVALLRSPHFRIAGGDGEALGGDDIAALERALSESSYLGGIDALDETIERWQGHGARVSRAAIAGALALQRIARQLVTLRSPAAVADHIDVVLRFLTSHESVPGADDPLRVRQLRARAAVFGLLYGLRDAYARFNPRTVAFEEMAAIVRRGIDARTFAPRQGETGVHLVDADSAPFGEFEYVQLAGLVDGEWPDRPLRNIFYSPAILKDLGWPADADRVEAIRASFVDLLSLPSTALVVSTFSLEHDTIVSPSILLDDLAAFRASDGADTGGESLSDIDDRIVLSESARAWAARRLTRPVDAFAAGQTAPHNPPAYSVSSLERYQDCPFKFFASDVLHLDEIAGDEAVLSPRARGRFIHEVFQRFFEAWDRRGDRTITTATIETARQVFADVAEPLLATLPEADAVLERTRLFGSAIAVGIVDIVLGLEASQPVDVIDRWLEYRLDGHFTLGATDAHTVSLRGVADRIDLLTGNRLRIIDYKSGSAPNPKRALQVPIYALCARERLAEQGGGDWTVDEAAYVAFTGKKTVVRLINRGSARDDAGAVLGHARSRLLDIVSAIERGEFPVRPYESRICSYCAYPSVCRKDYVGDE